MTPVAAGRRIGGAAAATADPATPAAGQTPGGKPGRPEPELHNVLDQSTGFLLVDTARLVRRVLYNRLARHGIRGGSWFVLRALWESDAPTQRELSNRLGTTQSSTLEMLRTMEGDGLVRFERDTLDRRKLRVHLTDRARALKAPLTDLANETNGVMLSRLSPAEDLLFKKILQTIRDTLTAEIARISRDAAADDPPAALNLQDEVAPAVPKRKSAGRTK